MGNLDARSLIAGLVAGLLIFFLLDRWQQIGSILGLLLLLVGIARISRALRAPEAEPEEPRTP